MVNDLLGNYDFTLMTIEDVIELLGTNSLSIVALIRHIPEGENPRGNLFSFEVNDDGKLTLRRAGMMNDPPHDMWYMVNELMQDYNFISMTRAEALETLEEHDFFIRELSLHYQISGGSLLSHNRLSIIFNENLEVTHVVTAS